MPEGNLFRTRGRTGVSAGDPPVQESSRLDAETSDRRGVQQPERAGAGPLGSPAVQESRSTEVQTSKFTWAQRPDQALAVDSLMLTLRRQLGRARLDKRDALWALVQLASEDAEVLAALVRKLRETA